MYNHKEIESKWQKKWFKEKSFKTTNTSDKKYYALDMFPYPSGSGLHVGHPEGYTATDIIARFKRLQGYDVLHPIGWDAFGLPAEQYAIKTNNHPASFTNQNINKFRIQLQKLGFSYDYDKEVNTTDPNYYKWTQWIFQQIYKKGLAEIKDIEVNWCEGLGTVLANEEVLTLENGQKVSERGEFPVVKRKMKQWVLKITNYAQKLLDGIEGLDWPNSLKSLQKNWIGKETKNGKVTFKIKDWVFARQRYWGEPFPIYFDENNDVYLVEDLPLILPELKNFKPSGSGEGPLANKKDWVNFEHNGKKMRHDTNTMPQWAGSCWYYLAYILKNSDGSYLSLNSQKAFKRFEKWMPVDLYVGGQEHAVLHLIYARFWHKVLYDLKIVPNPEPFTKIVNQGMILGPDNQKMSKSKGNVINPDEIVNELGADTLRVYEMFMGPLTDTKAWSTSSIKGIRKWLERIYQIYESNIIKISNDNELELETNILVNEITSLISALKFNVAISKMMVFINLVYKHKQIGISNFTKFLIILSPFAPHLSEEVLNLLNQKEILNQKWPEQKNIEKSNTTLIIVQVMGKLRDKLEVKMNLSKEEVIDIAKKSLKVSAHLKNKKVKKIIYIKNKILNFVTD